MKLILILLATVFTILTSAHGQLETEKLDSLTSFEKGIITCTKLSEVYKSKHTTTKQRKSAENIYKLLGCEEVTINNCTVNYTEVNGICYPKNFQDLKIDEIIIKDENNCPIKTTTACGNVCCPR